MRNSILGRIVSKLFVLLFCMTMALSIFTSRAIGGVYDDFEGSQINPTLWRINDPCSILSQSDGFLRASGPPTSCYGRLSSARKFGGDFEFVIRYSNFKSTATKRFPTGNIPQIQIQVSTQGEFIQIFRAYFGSDFFVTNHFINGNMMAISSADASSQSGSLKISRIGSTVYTYYEEGVGWHQLGSFEGAFTGDTTIQIMVYTGDDGGFHVSSDTVYAPDQGDTCPQQLQVLQAQVSTLTSQIETLTAQNQTLTLQNSQLQDEATEVNSGLSNIQQTLAQAFSNPQFTIPGAMPLQKYQNLVNAILSLNRGRLQGLYMNLGGK